MKKNKQKSVNEILESAKNIHLYGRVSTDKQDEDLPRQKLIIKEFLERHNKKFDIDSFKSDVKSAYSKSYEERSAFKELLETIGKGDTIIVSDRDRLSRQTDEHFSLRELLDDLGIPVIIASKNETYNSEDFLKNLVEDALTRLESDTISTRTKAAMKTLMDKGKYLGGQMPYGYKKDTKEVMRHGKNRNVVIGFEEIPDQIALVKEVFDLYKTSETFNSIAKHLCNKESDKTWTADKVKRIVLNPVYTGHFVYNRYQDQKKKTTFNPETEWIWKEHEFIKKPLISKEEWWDCWYKYQKTRQKPRYLYTTFYFNDIIRCHCGEKLAGKDQRTKGKTKPYGHRYYVCQNKSCKCKVLCEELDDLFQKIMLNLPFPEKLIHDQIIQLTESELAATTALIKKAERELQGEKQNLDIFAKYERKFEKNDVYLQESNNYKALAFLISKGDSEEHIRQLTNKFESLEESAQNLRKVLSNTHLLKEKVKSFFEIDEWEKLSNLQKRHLVLLATEECQLTNHNTVKLSLRCLPTQVFGLKGIEK